MASEQHKKYWEALQRLINAAWHKPDAAWRLLFHQMRNMMPI